MWSTNALTERLKLKFPIIQAPMGIVTTLALAAAVATPGAWATSGCEVCPPRTRRGALPGFASSVPALNVNYPIWLETGRSCFAANRRR